MEWFCERCENIEVERKTVIEPTDKLMIIRRFLSLDEKVIGIAPSKPALEH